MIIHDPNGYYAKVTEYNRLRIDGMAEPMLPHAIRFHGTGFAWTMVSYDYDAADTLLLVRNDSTTQVLYIEYVYVWVDCGGSVIVLQHPTATFTIAGTAVTGVNLNMKSGTAADATAKADETGNTQGDIIDVKYSEGTNSPGVLFLAHNGLVALGYHDAIGVDAVTGGDACQCTIHGYYHAED